MARFCCPTPDPRSFADGVFPSNIGRANGGVKMLGGPVSIDSEYCCKLVLARVDKTVHLMNCVRKLKDPQCELLLLRSCTSVSKLYFTLRTTNPRVLGPAIIHYDHHLFKYLQHLITGDVVGFGPFQQRLVTLPIKDGGMGIYTMADTIQYCYLASCVQYQALQ